MNQHVYITFGRFQPPTIGHEVLFKTMLTQATRTHSDVAVFVSQTQDPQNPLSHSERVSAIRKTVPGVLIGPKQYRTPAEALDWAEDMGYTRITLMVGSDRLENFIRMTKSWQQYGNDPSRRKLSVNVTSLPRTGSMDASKVSGTVARKYAQRGDLKNFKKILISGAATDDRMARQLLRSIQQRVGSIKESIMTKVRSFLEQQQFISAKLEATYPSADVDGRAVDPAYDPNAEYDPMVSVRQPDNSGEIDHAGRVPEDTQDNKSIIVIYPDRKLKYDMRTKAAQAKEDKKNSTT